MAAKKKTVKDLMEEMDREYAVILVSGKAKVLNWQMSEIYPELEEPIFSTPSDIRTYMSNRMISRKSEEGETKTPVFDYWMKRADRPSAKGLCLEYSDRLIVRGAYNLWRGFGVTPQEGDCDLIVNHIYEVMCRGVEEHGDYVMNWMAWKVQNPTEVPMVALVFRGLKGSGKGTLGARVFGRIFGIHGLHITSRKSLTGAFNAHLTRCCFLLADEAFWPGDKQGEGILKGMITEPTLTIEPKGVDAHQVRNHLGIMFLSNERWVVPATTDERRFAVFDVSDKYVQNEEYFQPLLAQIENGGTEAFLDLLQKRELGDWHPRMDIPVTEGLQDQQQDSAGPLDNWMGELLDEGMLPTYVANPRTGQSEQAVDSYNPRIARQLLLLEHARRSGSKASYIGAAEFKKYLKEHGVTKASRSAKGQRVMFPPLPEARRLFRHLHPWWPAWEEEDFEDWMLPHDVRARTDSGFPDEDHEEGVK